MQVLSLDRIPDDWMCWNLEEKEVTKIIGGGSNQVRRTQVMRVRKDEIFYEEETDLGPAKGIKHDLLTIESRGFTKVGKVRDMAHNIRQEKNFSDIVGLEPPDLPKLWEQYTHETWAKAKHSSTFGPAVTRVRS